MPWVKKLKLNDYWSSEFLTSTPSFSQIMPKNRYLLLRIFHIFADNTCGTNFRIKTTEKICNSFDSNFTIVRLLCKIRIILDHVRNAFKQCQNPFQNVYIDESLLLFKGWLFFRQYIPSTRHWFGIKLLLLCDCETGYIHFII